MFSLDNKKTLLSIEKISWLSSPLTITCGNGISDIENPGSIHLSFFCSKSPVPTEVWNGNRETSYVSNLVVPVLSHPHIHTQNRQSNIDVSSMGQRRCHGWMLHVKVQQKRTSKMDLPGDPPVCEQAKEGRLQLWTRFL